MLESQEYHNLKKIEKKCNIYYNHIRCEKNSNIYTSSITHDDGTMYVKNDLEINKQLSWKQKTDIYIKMSNQIKENEFVNW